MLPNVSNFSSQHSDKLVERHNAQLQHDTQGRILKELPVGSTVGYRDHANNQFHVGVVSEWEGRLYAIITESGRIISQNCIDLRWTNVPYKVSYANFKHVPPIPDNTNAYSLMRVCVCKQSYTRTTVLTMPAKYVTYWYLLLKGKSMPYIHNIPYFITVLAHLVYITKKAYAIILFSVCIVISINVITVIISVIIDVIVAIIVIVDIIYVQPSQLHVLI